MSIKQSQTLHVRKVTGVDSTPPTGNTGRAEITEGRAIDMEHAIFVNVYCILGGSITAATVVPYWWDETSQTWVRDAEQSITIENASVVGKIEARGRWCQPRVDAMTGSGSIAITCLYPIFYGLN